MIEQKIIRISNNLYNKYCNHWSHYYDPIELSPKDKDIIFWFLKQNTEGKEVAKLAKTNKLQIYHE